ncbi:MAG: DUF1640 domain-containing protein [Magnetococcales bacterium]|nr:DUF1640 domain-containing protein [Magnetococcales bacterium]
MSLPSESGHVSVFDTYSYVRRLRDAGMNEEWAAIQAEQFVSVIENRLASKEDIAGLHDKLEITKVTLQKEMEANRLELKRDIAEIHARLESTKADLHKEIASTKADLHKEIASTKADLHKEIESVRLELKRDIAEIHAKLESTRAETKRDLATVEANLKRDIKELEMTTLARMQEMIAPIKGEILVLKWMISLVIAVQIIPLLKGVLP